MTKEDPLGWPQHLLLSAPYSDTVRVQCHGIRRQRLLRGASSSLFLVRGWPCGRMEGSRLIADDCCAEGTSVEGVMGLLDDNDFTYAYTDYDQVVGLAGHHVADDWLQTRARVEEELLGAGAKVVEVNPKGSVTLRPVRRTIYKKKP